jgi:hypothetical protein
MIIVQFILDLDLRGSPLPLRGVKEMANRLLADRDASFFNKNWASNFIRRQPELKMHFQRRYNYQMARCEDPTVISDSFRLVQNTIIKYDIQPDDIYNFDKADFIMSMIAVV